MARLGLISACKAACLARKPVSQQAGAALKGLQHLCRPAADLSAGNNTIQATAPAVEITPQQSPAQCGQDEACLQQLIRTARFVNDKSARLLYSSRGHQFDEALGQFFADILAVCARTESRVNHIHLTAILGGLAKAWATAKACHVVHNHQQAGNDLHRFTAKILEMLQPLCKTLGVREASSLLSSLSKLNTDPGLLVPGTLDAIVQQLMANMHSANGQDLADVTAALTMLQSTPCYKDLMLAVSSQLAGGGLSNADSTRVASILHSLATTPSAAHSTKALNALCERFSVQLRSHRLADLPLGARPAPPKCHLSDDGKLCGALKQLQLPFRSPVFIRGYWADAVLDSPGNKAQPIILTVSRPDYIRNIPGRLTGRLPLIRILYYCFTADRGHWQSGQQDRLYHCTLLIAWGVKQLVQISEILTSARWHDSKQPLSLMLPGQKSAVLVLQMLLSDVLRLIGAAAVSTRDNGLVEAELGQSG
ncbi:hypothetical protein WJX79_005413 [Trebouxia sp. C0005]